jgi:uncharacterized protein (TIGR03067 family)
MIRTLTRAAASLLALAALAAGLGLFARPAHTAQDKDGKEALNGTWSAESLTVGGKPIPEVKKVMQLTFADGKVVLSVLGKTKPGTITFDASKTPKQFEMKIEGERPNSGIYRLEKDTLTLCFTEGSAPRPAEFKSEAGTRHILLVLKRGAAKLTPEEAKKLRDKIERAATKLRSANNLKQIALAMHFYHDANKRLPAPAILSKDGKPLLSWRVAVLPYLEQQELYKQFKLDEPWDSAHNKKLLEKMPPLYAPVTGKTKQPHSTYYQVFVGPGTAFEPGKNITLLNITDGTSNTVMAVEAGEAVPWTKPQDLPYDPQKDLPKLGGLSSDGLFVAMCDGAVRWMPRPFDARLFRLAITRNDGQEVDFDKLFR